MFGQRLEADIVREMVAYDEELKVNYTIYQRLLRALTNKDYIALKRYLHTSNSSLLSRYMRTSIRTLKKYLPYKIGRASCREIVEVNERMEAVRRKSTQTR